MNLLKYLLMVNKNISKVKYYLLFGSALFILILFFDSKSSKSESYLNTFLHDIHTTKKPFILTQNLFEGKIINAEIKILFRV